MNRAVALRRSVIPAVGLATALGAAAFGAGYPRVGGALVALLIGALLVLAWDARRRLGEVAHLLRLSADRQRQILARVGEVPVKAPVGAPVHFGHDGAGPTQPADDVRRCVERLERLERRMIASVQEDRLLMEERFDALAASIGGVPEKD